MASFNILWAECMCPPKFICWNLNPHVMVLGGGPFESWLGHEGGALKKVISALKEETGEPACSLYSPLEDKRSQEVGLYQTLDLSTSWSWTSQLPELWETNVCYL